MSATISNDVMLFSNGIGHFRRTYHVGKENVQLIQIPFKKDHIGDVAASLQVFGEVGLSNPPSFTPSNSEDTFLKIDPDNATLSLLKSLSGAKISYTLITASCSLPINSTLLGIDYCETVIGGQTTSQIYVCLMNDLGEIKSRPLSQINNIQFTEDSVKAEINKALKRNYQKIKPESTMLEVSLETEKENGTDAVLQYTIPVAAWKMRYAIREEKGAFSLEGSAVIDNNTDEDWVDFRISVVTGNPNSFRTNIADIVVPSRTYIPVVDAVVNGNVSYEESCGSGFESSNRGVNYSGQTKVVNTRGASAKFSISNYSKSGLESLTDDLPDDESVEGMMSLASTPGVDSKEVGDFCVYTSKEPITIISRKSAIVPMFNVPLDNAGVILLYKASANSSRPFRSVKFKNNSNYSLGKGKTVVYNGGVFSGECILEMTKPGENRMLPHCLENGVRIVKESSPTQSKKTSLKISNGLAIVENALFVTTTYKILNKKPEKFKFALEHNNALGANTSIQLTYSGVAVNDSEKISDGSGTRFYFTLAESESLTFEVKEKLIESHTQMIGNNFFWIEQMIGQVGIEDPVISSVRSIQLEIDSINKELNYLAESRELLEEQQERTRKNIASVKQVTDSSGDWINDLNNSESSIKEIDSKKPLLQNKKTELEKKLSQELSKISFNLVF